MGAHGCIRVCGEGFRKGVLLHTTHTGGEIPNIVREAPVLVIKERDYLKTEEKIRNALIHDGALWERLFYPQCVCSLLIAVRPMMLCHVSPSEVNHLAKWSGADNPWILKVKDGLWRLTNPDTKEVEEIDPVKLMVEYLKKSKLPQTFTLTQEELLEAVQAPHDRDKLLIHGLFDKENWQLVFLTGDLKVISIPVDEFHTSGDGTRPDFDDIALMDYGHTLRLGSYEASSRFIVEYKGES